MRGSALLIRGDEAYASIKAAGTSTTDEKSFRAKNTSHLPRGGPLYSSRRQWLRLFERYAARKFAETLARKEIHASKEVTAW